MAHKKKAHSKQAKMTVPEPMAHAKGPQHLKSMKDHKMKKGK